MRTFGSNTKLSTGAPLLLTESTVLLRRTNLMNCCSRPTAFVLKPLLPLLAALPPLLLLLLLEDPSVFLLQSGAAHRLAQGP